MTDPASTPTSIDPLDPIRAVALVYEIDAALLELFERGLLPAPPPRLSGRATAAVGTASALRRRVDGTGDLVALSMSLLGAALSMGISPRDFFRQCLGRSESVGRGRAPAFQFSDPMRGVFGPISPPGTALEVMAGVTLALKMQGQDRVGVVHAGREMPSTGAWHEGLNLAAVRRCPMVVLADAPAAPSRLESLLEICDGYGICGASANADDLGDTRGVIEDAVTRARAGEGVQLVELRFSEDPPPASQKTPDEVVREIREEIAEAMEGAVLDRLPDREAALEGIRTDSVPLLPWFRDADSEARATAGSHDRGPLLSPSGPSEAL